jgi:hypothetical protein
MKKNFFIALMGTFALATTSCSKDAKEAVDKTEYTVVVLVEYYNSSTGKRKALEGAEVALLDYNQAATTDDDGKATLTLQRGNYRMSIEKKGYKYYDTYNVNTFDSEEYVTLRVRGNQAEAFTLSDEKEQASQMCIVKILRSDGSKIPSVVYPTPVERDKAPTGPVIGADAYFANANANEDEDEDENENENENEDATYSGGYYVCE